MTATIKLVIELDPGEKQPEEAEAVRNLQDALAVLARTPVDELVAIWRQAVIAQKDEKRRARHAHGRRERS